MSPRKKSPAPPRPRKSGAPAPARGQARPEPAAAGDPLAAIARAQDGQPSAESFWKAAGRFSKLR